MEKYIDPAHWILTWVLMALYLLLAIRFFRKNESEIIVLDRALVQIARYLLLLVYITGLFKSVTFGIPVHKLHHTLGLIPAVIMVGIRYLPYLTKRENSTTTYAWIFAIMLALIMIIGASSYLSVLPKF